jgi:ribonucleoside-diphosphate reductase alpha chain
MEININYTRDNLFDDAGLKKLQDGYMLPDEDSPQDSIARAAKAWSAGDEELAQRLYDYASQHWFFFASPVLSNAPSDSLPARGMPISCFVGDTPIITDSGFTEIQDIKKGDKVLTHKGRFRKVLATKSSRSNDLYKVVVDKRRTPLTVTGNHLLLTNVGWVRVDELKKDTHLIATDYRADIKEEEYDISICNSNTPSAQFKRSQLFEKVSVTKELAWALGFWFAEGCTSSNGAVRVTHGTEEPCKKWADIIASSFGLGSGIVTSSRTWFNGEVYSKTLQEWFDEEFGKGCTEKTLTDWIVALPKGCLEEFWEGFYLGDGFKTAKVKAVEVTNPKLIAGFHLILNKLGVKHSLQLRKRTPAGRFNGIITLSNNQDKRINRGIEFLDGLIYSKILEVTNLDIEDTVYDIQVEEDESFSAAGVIAHNCFLNYVTDSRTGINEHWSENTWLASAGGGIGGYWGELRSIGEKTSAGNATTGIIPFLKVVDTQMLAVKQGNIRRGGYAAYLDISHPESEEFIRIRQVENGDINRKCQNLHHGINVTDKFMSAVEEDLPFDLIDPHSKNVVKTVNAREIWQTILRMRYETGEPYIHFVDTTNKLRPEALKELGLPITQSNLCSEITLPTGIDHQDKMRTAVCCLSSLNLEKFDEWKDTNIVKDLVTMLDNVLDYYIENTNIDTARYSALRERSIGIGTMGFHSYLQSKSIPFDSPIAVGQTNRIYAHIRKEAEEQTEELGKLRGSCPDYLEYTVKAGIKGARRNLHLLAIAPNASSSIICGNTSPSVEPLRANSYTQKTLTGTITYKNKFLDSIIRTRTEDAKEYKKVWKSINDNRGSVQHVDILTEQEKQVFKTAIEIDQQWVVEHASHRQNYVDQSQSINLFFPPNCDKGYLNKVHLAAYKKGLKTLYYCRTEASSRVENINVKVEKHTFDVAEGCLSCEG